MTRRQARRRLGSRTARRANTNGKVMNTGGNGNKRKPCRRNPLPVKNLGWKIRTILDEAHGR